MNHAQAIDHLRAGKSKTLVYRTRNTPESEHRMITVWLVGRNNLMRTCPMNPDPTIDAPPFVTYRIPETPMSKPVGLMSLTNEFGNPTPEFGAAIRKAADEIESGPQYAGTVLHALVEDLFELGYEPETDASAKGTATLWQVDHVDGDWPWIVEHASLDDPEFIGPQPDDVTDAQLVEAVRNMLDADPCTFVIRRRGKTAPPVLTEKPPECDCWLVAPGNLPPALRWDNGTWFAGWHHQTAGDFLPEYRFLAIPGGIPSPE